MQVLATHRLAWIIKNFLHKECNWVVHENIANFLGMGTHYYKTQFKSVFIIEKLNVEG